MSRSYLLSINKVERYKKKLNRFLIAFFQESIYKHNAILSFTDLSTMTCVSVFLCQFALELFDSFNTSGICLISPYYKL